jgi:hypothetical protein
VPPRVVRRERLSLVVVRRVSDEVLAPGIRQRVDGAVEAEPRERLRLAAARRGPKPARQSSRSA